MSNATTQEPKAMKLSSSERRIVECPVCLAGKGRPCHSLKIGSASRMGGGWGGYPQLDREHPARVQEAREALRNADSL